MQLVRYVGGVLTCLWLTSGAVADGSRNSLLKRIHDAIHSHVQETVGSASNVDPAFGKKLKAGNDGLTAAEIAALVADGMGNLIFNDGDEDLSASGSDAHDNSHDNGNSNDNSNSNTWKSVDQVSRDMGPRLNLPEGEPQDFDYFSESGQAALMPPTISDSKCGNAPVVPAHVPSWGAPGEKPEWCLSTPAAPRGADTPTYLAAHLYVRTYDGDLSALTKLDIAHHMTYYRYAGYERVYIYDNWLYEWERVDKYPPIAEAIASGFCVYNDWHKGAASNWNYKAKSAINKFMYKVQYPESTDAMNKYHDETRWMSFMDMDEYPFQSTDKEPGFFSRFLVHDEQRQDREDSTGVGACRRITQYTLPNFLVQGGRDYSKGPMLAQQVERVVNKPLNALVKQIVRMDARSSFAVHTSRVKFGSTRSASTDANKLRMYHFQGGRGTKWQSLAEMSSGDRAALLKRTFQCDMDPILERVLMCFDPDEVASWPTLQEERAQYEAANPGAYP